MFRVIIELLITIAVLAILRVVITGFMKSISGAASETFQQPRSQSHPETPPAGLLHKDPVCGTFVAESSPFRRQVGRETVFYCSEACLKKQAR